jgi:rSAM/selenodomain-associated transferase 2
MSLFSVEPSGPVLSIVIPTYEAAEHLARTLPALAAAPLAHEIVVADGGSADGTAEVAARHGARVIAARQGRGHQLKAGAEAALGGWLLFLHADTLPAPGWTAAVERFRADPANERRAGFFRFALDDASPAARRLERLVAWRARRLALPYGDQGLLIGRRFYDELGGFRAIPLMEDVDIVRRIGRRRLALIDVAAVTSAETYRREGYLLRPLRNLSCLALYFLGVPPAWIERVYR